MYSKVAVAKTNKSISRLVVQGILAGFMIGIGGYASQLATVLGMSKAVSASIFPVGLIMVVLTGAELFTGNCLMPAALVNGQIKAVGMLRVWVFSYIGNLLGSLILAAAVRIVGTPEYLELAANVAATKTGMPVGEMLVRAILCNVLVCIAVWMAINADSTIGKAACAFVPVFTFVFCGFEHSVANMFFLAAGGAPIGAAFVQIAIVTVGNIIGGALLGIMVEGKAST